MSATRRGALVAALLVGVLWPSVGGAQDAPTDTTAPDTTAPDTVPTDDTVGPPTTVAEEPPATTVPEEPVQPEVPVATTDTPDAAEARSLTVTPHTNLVHHQVVIARGKGWVPNTSIQGVAQCISGATDTSGCGPIEYVTNDARGNFRVEFEVDVILDTSDGVFDCRVDTCVLGTNDVPSVSSARLVELSFDPAGPDPTRRTVTVTPDTGLVDQQQVTVTGDDFDTAPGYGGYAEVRQCRLPAAGYGDCDQSTSRDLFVEAGGHLEDVVWLEAILHFADGTTQDCRLGGCVLFVRQYDESFFEAALAPLGFDPVAPLAPPPTVVVDPSTGILDGQILDVSGAGWRPVGTVGALICPETATHYRQCDSSSFTFADIDESGGISFQMYVRAVFPSSHGPVDCRDTDCAVFVARSGITDVTRASQGPIELDPDGPLLSPEFTTGDLDGLHGGQVVEVSGERGRPEGAVELLQCLAGADRESDCMLGTRQFAHTGGDDLSSRRSEGNFVGFSWEADVTLRQFLHLPDGRLVDCHLTPCALVAIDARAELDRSDRIATGFEAAPPDGVGPISATPTFAG